MTEATGGERWPPTTRCSKGLLETYETAIAELEEWDDAGTATLLASMKRLRDRALGRGREFATPEFATPELAAH